MPRLITIDDFVDTYAKIRQRGLSFFISKLTPNATKRTKSAFNELDIESSNWWIIPKVEQRWNKLITGNANLNYETFVVKNFLREQKNIKMLSIGSGLCTHELEFASHENFSKIICMDISNILLKAAADNARTKNLNNIEFLCQNIYDYDFPENEFDIVFFHASLHHFKHMEEFLGKKIKKILKPNGKLIINEFVGATRLQFPKHQIEAVNQALKLVSKKYRKRYRLNLSKNSFRGSGLIRMVLADPSECVESSNIMPTIRKHYETLYEAPFGGNILMNVLKDISHHFVKLNNESEKILDALFEFEDDYLLENKSDFIFGVYKNI